MATGSSEMAEQLLGCAGRAAAGRASPGLSGERGVGSREAVLFPLLPISQSYFLNSKTNSTS